MEVELDMALLAGTEVQIVDMYREIGSGNETARRLNISIPTVYKVLHRHGVTLTRRTGKLRAPDDAIVEAYQRLGSGVAVTKELPVCYKTVYDVLTARGIQTGVWHKTLRGVQGDDEQRVIDLHHQGLSAPEIAKQLGVKTNSVRSHLQRSNIPLSKPLTPEEKHKILALYRAGLTATQAGAGVGATQAVALRFLQREYPDVIRRLGKRESSPTWKGGRVFHKGSGYMYVHVSDTDPYADMRTQEGYVAEHRIVMARTLGRLLLSTETVHHIDGDKLNNVPSNLQIRHGRHGKNIVPCCLDCGSRNIGTAPLD